MFARQKRVHYIIEEKKRLITGEVKKLTNRSTHPEQDSSEISTYGTFHFSVSISLVTPKSTSK